MTRVAAAILLFAASIMVQGFSPASAKTCECKQHEAKATAVGTCSRSEDSSLCAITFADSEPDDESLNMARRIARDFHGSTLGDPLRQFIWLSEKDPGSISAEQFRELFMYGLLFSYQNLDLVEHIYNEKGLKPGLGMSYRIDDHLKSYRRRGCFEYNDDGISYLLIGARSQSNGSCD